MLSSSSRPRCLSALEPPSSPPLPSPVRTKATSRITARTHLTEPSEESGRCTRDRLLEVGEQFAGCGMVGRQQAFLGQEVETRRGINATECLFGQTGGGNRFPIGGHPCVGDDPQSWIRTGHPAEPNLL